MTTTISADGLLRIPELFRQTDSIEPGQRFDIERLGRGEYRVKAEPKQDRGPAPSLVDLLLACPVKGFLTVQEPEQTTDDLPPLRFE